MVRIHGLVFVVVGLAVAITSKIVDSASDNDSMALFFYLGIVMVVYGGLGVFVFRKKSTKIEKKIMYQPVQTKPQINPQIHQPPQPPLQQRWASVKYCSNCGSGISASGNFCHACGARLK